MIFNPIRDSSNAFGLSLLLAISVFGGANFCVCLQAFGAPVLLGDVDFDGDLDAEDANLLTAGIAMGSFDPSLDVNGSGFVDLADLDLFFDSYSAFNGVPLSVALVDVNFDTVNTSADHDIIVSNLSLPLTAFTAGNLFVDGVIDSTDLSLYLSRGGVVPEPATCMILFSALFFAAARVRRRR